jgi:RecB family endonuclease NucS
MTKNLWMIQADYQEPMKIVLMDLFKKFDLDEEQQHQCWLNMEKKEMKSEIPEN